MTWWDDLAIDLQANAPGLDEAPGRCQMLAIWLRNIATVRFLAVALFRCSQGAGRRWRLAGSALKQINHIITGCDIAYQATIGPGMILYHPTGVVIGPHCVIGRSCTIQQGITVGAGGGGSPKIGDEVVIGPGARVIGDVVVGNRARIGANAVVLREVDPDTVVAGVPARVIRGASSSESDVQLNG